MLCICFLVDYNADYQWQIANATENKFAICYAAVANKGDVYVFPFFFPITHFTFAALPQWCSIFYSVLTIDHCYFGILTLCSKGHDIALSSIEEVPLSYCAIFPGDVYTFFFS